MQFAKYAIILFCFFSESLDHIRGRVRTVSEVQGGPKMGTFLYAL